MNFGVQMIFQSYGDGVTDAQVYDEQIWLGVGAPLLCDLGGREFAE